MRRREEDVVCESGGLVAWQLQVGYLYIAAGSYCPGEEYPRRGVHAV